MSKRVGFVILGAGGYMGINALKVMRDLLPELSKEGVEAKLLCLAEPFTRHWVAIAENHPPDHSQLLIFPNLDEILEKLEPAVLRDAEDFPIIFYDASPTSMHYPNLELLYQEASDKHRSYSYFGEKPIFLDKKHIDHAQKRFKSGFHFFCELIETENPVFREVEKYLKDHRDLRIERVWMWRAGSSGVKKAIGADRPGVQGGALLDKSAHDLSITVGWLDPNKIVRAAIRDATAHKLLIAPEYYFKQTTSVLSTANGYLTDINIDLEHRSRLPADGLFSMDVTWELADQRSIPAHYIFSWMGVTEGVQEIPIINMLDGFGLRRDEWLLDEGWVVGPNDEEVSRLNLTDPPRYAAHVREARVGVLECRDGDQTVYIVCNFLSQKERKDGADAGGSASARIHRFARIYRSKGGKYDAESLYEERAEKSYNLFKQDDMVKIFKRVALHCLDEHEASCVSNRATLLIHEVMLEAQDIAMLKWTPVKEVDEHMRELLPEFEKRIRPE